MFDSKKRILISTKPYLDFKQSICLYRKTVLLEKKEDETFGFELQVRGGLLGEVFYGFIHTVLQKGLVAVSLVQTH